MRFGISVPWWTLVPLLFAVLVLAWGAYAQPLTPLAPRRRVTLSLLRAATLLAIAVCLLRPIKVLPPLAPQGDVVPVLVDISRSMRIADAGGRARIDVARDLAARDVAAALPRFRTEVWTFGDSLQQPGNEAITAHASQSDLSGALRAVRERYRDRRVPGIVVVSDGGDTGRLDAAATADATSAPVFTIGIGASRLSADVEVVDVAAGEARLADSAVDLTVSAVARGDDRTFELRLLENGRPIDVRQVTSPASGTPVQTIFTVSPPAGEPTLYTIEIPARADETVRENNQRSVLVESPGRKRRVLIVESAPGFEHSFVKRALMNDEGLEIDSVVRKGRDAQGQSTYFVQAAADRAPGLTAGFPADRAALFQYDALILANMENDSLAGAQLQMAEAFVAERGGGLLVLGAKSFGPRGLTGTAIERALPTDLADRGNGVVKAVNSDQHSTVNVTRDGQAHPVMRIGATPEDTARRWSGVPALADAVALGVTRPGAQVLATMELAGGPRPLVAVQRYGLGRSMVFTGEASWRWRMQLPAADRTFELFWRQTARWLSAGAPDPVAIAPVPAVAVGETASIGFDVRTRSFDPVADARATLRIVRPDGSERTVRPTLSDARTGHYSADYQFDRPGVYRVIAEARRGADPLGQAERWILAGGADREMADPRLNEDVLRRVSFATGGEYLRPESVSRLSALQAGGERVTGEPRIQELWDRPWTLGIIILLLATEWVMRRQWGLR